MGRAEELGADTRTKYIIHYTTHRGVGGCGRVFYSATWESVASRTVWALRSKGNTFHLLKSLTSSCAEPNRSGIG